MSYLGDFVEDATVTCIFTTHDKNGGAIDPSTPFEAADIKWYRDGSAFAPVGITMTSPFVSTGQHKIVVDTSNTGGDAWLAGADYTAVLAPDETIDSETVIRTILEFSIENRFNQTVVPPTEAQMNARTIVSANYTVVADLGTVQSGDSFAIINGTHGLVSIQDDIDILITRLTAARAGYLDELAAANLPADIDTLLTRLTDARAAFLDASISSRGTTDPGDTMALTNAAVDALWDEVMELGITARQSFRLSNSYFGGQTDGGGTVTIHFRDLADTLNRITMTVDAEGDRDNVVLNLA